MVKSNQSYFPQKSIGEEKFQNGYNFDIVEDCMLFANRKELYVANGSSIQIYNPIGGSLIEELEGHSCKIVSICKNAQSKEEEAFVSCDEKGHVFKWFSDRKHPDHGTSFHLSLGENNRITHFSMSQRLCIYSFVTSDDNKASLALLDLKNMKNKFVITKDVQPGQSKVAMSYDGKYIAALKFGTVFITDVASQISKKNQIYRHHRTKLDQCCVVFHPTQDTMAVGSVDGSLTLWHHVLQKSPTKNKLHWHSMPLRTFCFSSTGADIYSGGEETVLVRWRLAQSLKSFLPRLGMPIRGIRTDPSNSLVAVQHSDNSISIIDSESMKLKGSIQRISRHVLKSVRGVSLLNVGLLYHSPSASCIKNGKTGHLQFFNPVTMNVNYNVDITMSNFISEERHRELPNADVSKAAVTDDGSWLVTVEVCYLTETLKEIVMKFWKFVSEQQSWELNTSIQSPHSDTITSLTFKHGKNDVPMCLSCSEDKKFKVWKLVTYEDVTGKERCHWNSRASREFRDLAAVSCAFALDNSLFAVAFENIVTLWTPEKVMMKRLLTQPYLKERISDISFSSVNCEGSALVTRSENYICSWDLLSCSLMWRVYIKSSCLAIDKDSGLMAVFANTKQVYFFEAKSCKPISSNYKINHEAVCGQFAPFDELTNDATRKKDSKKCLYFFDRKQDFLRLDLPSCLEENTVEDTLWYSSAGDKKAPIEPTTVENARAKRVDETSTLLSALTAKTKNITVKAVRDDGLNVNLSAPSMKDLLKDINDAQIHSASFLDFAAHLANFLPNLRADEPDKTEQIKYEIVTHRNEKKKVFDKVYRSNEEERIEALQKVDFTQLLQGLGS